jgi:hypothetical protein
MITIGSSTKKAPSQRFLAPKQLMSLNKVLSFEFPSNVLKQGTCDEELLMFGGPSELCFQCPNQELKELLFNDTM